MYIYDGEHANTQTVIPSLFPGGAQLRRWVTLTRSSPRSSQKNHMWRPSLLGWRPSLGRLEAIAIRFQKLFTEDFVELSPEVEHHFGGGAAAMSVYA